MKKYWMIVLVALVFVVGMGCESAVSSMEADEEGMLDARRGLSAGTLQSGTEAGAYAEGEGGGAGSGRSVASGLVEEVDVDRIRVQGIDYFVTAQTVLVDLQDQPVPLASITPGSTVKIEAQQRRDGSWVALYVIVANLAPPPTGRSDRAMAR